jgi:hypothetical protein
LGISLTELDFSRQLLLSTAKQHFLSLTREILWLVLRLHPAMPFKTGGCCYHGYKQEGFYGDTLPLLGLQIGPLKFQPEGKRSRVDIQKS